MSTFPIVADMARWDCRAIPFAPADATCITVVGDWSYNPATPEDQVIPNIVTEAQRRVAKRPDCTWAMLDIESGPLRARYGEIATALRAALPGHGFGVWVNDINNIPAFAGLLPNSYLWPECYQQRKTETLNEAKANVASKVQQWCVRYPSIPIMPCLSVENAAYMTEYPPSCMPLSPASNLRSRIEAVWALRATYANLKGISVWGGALSPDDARARAIDQIGDSVKTTINWQYTNSKSLYDSMFGARP